MGMCCWMGLHFHSWIDCNGVAFSLHLLEWDCTNPDQYATKNCTKYIIKIEQLYVKTCKINLNIKMTINYQHTFQRESSQNTKNGVSELQDIKIYLGEYAPRPSSSSCLWHWRDSFCGTYQSIKQTIKASILWVLSSNLSLGQCSYCFFFTSAHPSQNSYLFLCSLILA